MCRRHGLFVHACVKLFCLWFCLPVSCARVWVGACTRLLGRRQPDVSTRLFLKMVRDALKIPVLGLFDSDPYGLKIMSVYMSSSKNMSYDSAALTTSDIKWLGVRPSGIVARKSFCCAVARSFLPLFQPCLAHAPTTPADFHMSKAKSHSNCSLFVLSLIHI